MNVYQDWQNIAFLPVIHSLVEEHVRYLKGATNAHRGTLNRSTLEGWQHLSQAWQALPDKTDRQVQWLKQMESGLLSLRKEGFVSNCA